MFIMVYGVRRLDYHEFVLTQASVASVTRNARTVIQDKINARDVTTVIRSAASLSEIQVIIEGNAADIQLSLTWSLRQSFVRTAAEGHHRTVANGEALEVAIPIAQSERAGSDALFLNICSSTTRSRHPAGAERVAQILAPAIGSWVATRPVSPVTEVEREPEIVLSPGNGGAARGDRGLRVPDACGRPSSGPVPQTRSVS